MKITTGSARGKRLKSVPGEGTRPITDKVKQAVFNILMDDVRESRWLDMFGGTGAVGIEALSRGAAFCTFLDTAPDAIRIISANLSATGLAGKARAIRQDAFRFLFAKPNTEYDFIYIAPPQGKGLWSRALAALNDNPGWLKQNGTIIVQLSPGEYTPLSLTQFELDDERKYGRTMLLFYSRPTELSSRAEPERSEG